VIDQADSCKIADGTKIFPARGITLGKSGNMDSYEKKIALDGRSFKSQHQG